MLSNPASARRGNQIAAFGMIIAIAGTIFLYKDENGNHLHNYALIGAALIIGSVVGAMAARKVKMTAMPEMVSLFNGMGGACAALISIVEYRHITSNYFTQFNLNRTNFVMPEHNWFTTEFIIIFSGLIIGSVSFAGSMIAWGKLTGKIKDFSFNGQHIVNILVLLTILFSAIFTIIDLRSFVPSSFALTSFYFIFILALLYGILFVLPIGGADMPVVISLLNSFTGVAAACGGFLYDNKEN